MINNIFPEEWKKEKLSDVGYSFSGLRSKSKKDFDENGNAKFVNYRNINRNYFVDPNDLAPVHVGDNENQNYLLKGDVLFTGSSETPEEVAFSSVMREEIKDLYLNSFSFGYRFNNLHEFLPEFYAYFFRGPYFRKIVFPLAQGSTRYNISKNEILKIEVPIPPFTEQQKIATILSTVDEAIEKTEQIIEKTNIALKELTSQLITKGVNHKEYKTTKLGQIPKIWGINTLQEVSENKNGMRRGPFGGALKKDIFVSSGYAVYEQQHVIHNSFDNIRYFITEEKFKDMQNFEVKTDDILISCSGTVGKVVLVPQNSKPGIINQALLRIRIKSEILDIKYAYYLLSSNIMHNKMTDMSHGSTLKNIVSMKQLKTILIPVPPLKEQNEIVTILESIHLKLKVERDKLKKLENIKKGLMQQLLTGKVRVPMNENEEVRL